MIKLFKSNKFISLTLVIMCIIIMIKPNFYAKSCLNAISVWSMNVLPLLFPFFIFTRLIVNINTPKANFMDKFFGKLYHAPVGSFSTFFLATLSGYPMGAKLICTMYDNKQITSSQAKKMLSFCSVSGPMFMLGTVGLVMLKSYKAGLIILISNIIASLINGLIYRGKKEDITYKPTYTKSSNILHDSVYDSLISILMVGSYIVLSFLIIDMLKALNIITFLSNTIIKLFNLKIESGVMQSFLAGLIEITRGILDLSNTGISLPLKTIISSSLIAFGGVSIFLQSINFLSKLKIPTKQIIMQKITQAILCLLITIPIALIFI